MKTNNQTIKSIEELELEYLQEIEPIIREKRALMDELIRINGRLIEIHVISQGLAEKVPHLFYKKGSEREGEEIFYHQDHDIQKTKEFLMDKFKSKTKTYFSVGDAIQWFQKAKLFKDPITPENRKLHCSLIETALNSLVGDGEYQRKIDSWGDGSSDIYRKVK